MNIFLFYTLRGLFPEILRLWIGNLHKNTANNWHKVFYASWLINTEVFWNSYGFTQGFLRTSPNWVGLFLKTQEAFVVGHGLPCLSRMWVADFRSPAYHVFKYVGSLQYRRIFTGSLLQSWFSIKRLYIVKIGVNYVSKSPNHNLEDIY